MDKKAEFDRYLSQAAKQIKDFLPQDLQEKMKNLNLKEDKKEPDESLATEYFRLLAGGKPNPCFEEKRYRLLVEDSLKEIRNKIDEGLHLEFLFKLFQLDFGLRDFFAKNKEILEEITRVQINDRAIAMQATLMNYANQYFGGALSNNKEDVFIKIASELITKMKAEYRHQEGIDQLQPLTYPFTLKIPPNPWAVMELKQVEINKYEKELSQTKQDLEKVTQQCKEKETQCSKQVQENVANLKKIKDLEYEISKPKVDASKLYPGLCSITKEFSEVQLNTPLVLTIKTASLDGEIKHFPDASFVIQNPSPKFKGTIVDNKNGTYEVTITLLTKEPAQISLGLKCNTSSNASAFPGSQLSLVPPIDYKTIKFQKSIKKFEGYTSFSGPWGISFGSKGNLHIADTDAQKILIYDEEDTFVRSVIFQQQTDKPYPRGLAVNPNGDIYIAVSNYGEIQVFSSQGIPTRKYGTKGTGVSQFLLPRSVTLGPNMEVIVADTENHRIQILTDGDAPRVFGRRGKENGEFIYPICVACFVHPQAGTVLAVTDCDNHRIQMFNLQGEHIRTFGTLGSGPGQLNTPIGIGFDSRGNMIVADSRNNRIQIFDFNGKYIHHFGQKGQTETDFDDPKCLAVDKNGRIAVADFRNKRVQIYS